jgi:hypothetical protein
MYRDNFTFLIFYFILPLGLFNSLFLLRCGTVFFFLLLLHCFPCMRYTRPVHFTTLSEQYLQIDHITFEMVAPQFRVRPGPFKVESWVQSQGIYRYISCGYNGTSINFVPITSTNHFIKQPTTIFTTKVLAKAPISQIAITAWLLRWD